MSLRHFGLRLIPVFVALACIFVSSSHAQQDYLLQTGGPGKTLLILSVTTRDQRQSFQPTQLKNTRRVPHPWFVRVGLGVESWCCF
jgi:hypothetical protein